MFYNVSNSPKDYLADYLEFHNALDEFVWLIKLMYAPKSIIKSKKYRVDELFQYYIVNNDLKTQAKKGMFSDNNSKERFKYYLRQGWYNEISACYPFNKHQYNIGTSLPYIYGETWNAELFPSWLIIKSYYSMYAFYNSLLFTNGSNFNTKKHRSSTNHFNYTLLNKFSDYTIRYPFNICFINSDSEVTFRNIEREEWSFRYSCYPRRNSDYNCYPIKNYEDYSEDELNKILDEIHKRYENRKDFTSFYDIEKEYHDFLYKVKTDLGCSKPVNIIDLMYLFRTWANYTGSDTLVILQSGGYLKFLERNIFTVNYFIAGICELTAIDFLGEKDFSSEYMSFIETFIKTKSELYDNWAYIPMINRIRIYEHLNLINGAIQKDAPNNDNISMVSF